jgi:hypothetical protein
MNNFYIIHIYISQFIGISHIYYEFRYCKFRKIKKKFNPIILIINIGVETFNANTLISKEVNY